MWETCKGHGSIAWWTGWWLQDGRTCGASEEEPVMTDPPTLADLMADPGELDVSCLDCHHNTTMPVAALLPRYAAETPFPECGAGHRVWCAARLSRRRWRHP